MSRSATTRPAGVRADLAARREEVMHTIRQAAIAEFAVNGLHGASTQAIADRAGITKTRLHYYISSKEALYVEALRHIVDVWAELFHGLDMQAGPDVFLRDYIGRKIRHALDHPEVARMFTGEVMRGAPLLRPLWDTSREATRGAARVIDGWIAAGLIRPVDPVLLQFNIWALSQHYALHLSEARFMLDLPDDAPLDADHIAQEVTELVLRGLRV
jgi:TetR/AcrR family transcriptional regulator